MTIKLLVVDDRKDNIEIVELALSGKGYDVVSFLDPADAVSHFSVHFSEYDLILTDYEMQNLNGRVFTRIVKTVKPDIKVILSTGKVFDDLEKVDMKVDFFLPKPFDIDKLDKIIRDVLI